MSKGQQIYRETLPTPNLSCVSKASDWLDLGLDFFPRPPIVVHGHFNLIPAGNLSADPSKACPAHPFILSNSPLYPLILLVSTSCWPALTSAFQPRE